MLTPNDLPVSGFSLTHHMDLFLNYYDRERKHDWRNDTEKKIVHEGLMVHQHYAAQKLPDTIFTQLGIDVLPDALYIRSS